MIARRLLRRRDKSLHIGVFTLALDYEVHVILHEAARNNRKRLVIRSAKELRPHESDGTLFRKRVTAVIHTECKKIAVESEVVEPGEPTRMVWPHARQGTTCVPSGRSG